jgi:AmmeMemoRadiSam system protein A
MRTADSRLRPGWLDHASLVPLAFLDPEARYRLVVLSLTYLPYARHREVGEAVARATETLGRRVAFIASGDLSHRLTPDAPAGYSARGRELDASIVGLVEQGRLAGLAEIDPDLVEAGGECGMRSIIALGGYCCDDPAPVRVLAYEGPWGVGYLTAFVGRAAIEADDAAVHGALTGTKGGAPGEVESPIVQLARHSIEHRMGTGRPLNDAVLPTGTYPARAGAFVSLHLDGELRGCIGTISPTKDTLADEVAGNAIEAALHDPRFPPLEPADLAHLDISVDVLGAAEPCAEEDLDPSRYGVIVTSGWRRGLLLPDLEGVDDVGTQVGIALRKAGIPPGEPYSVERFKVDRYT